MRNIVSRIRNIASSFPEHNWNIFLENAISEKIIGSEEKNEEIKNDDTHFYIGSTISDNDEQVYSKSYIRGLIAYDLQNINTKKEDINVMIVSRLREILNQDSTTHTGNNSQEQRVQVEKIIQKDFPQYRKKIHIKYIQERHPALFAILEKDGIEGLLTDTPPILTKENFTSVDIAQHLLYAVKKNERLMYIFWRTKPRPLKDEQGKKEMPVGSMPSDYYAVIETAIHITDYLNGISNHVGPERQRMYDEIVENIVEGKMRSHHLDTLQHFIQDTKKKPYRGIYIDAQRIEENKNNKKNTMIKKTKIYLIACIAMGGIIAGSVIYNKYEKKQQEIMKTILREKIKNLHISSGIAGNIGFVPITGTDYVEPFVLQYAEGLKEKLRTRYGMIASQEEFIEIRMLEYLSKQSFWDIRNKEIEGRIKEQLAFIDTVFVPENTMLLEKVGIPKIPYEALYKENIIQIMQDYTGKPIAITNMNFSTPAWKLRVKEHKEYESKTFKGGQEGGIMNHSTLLHMDFKGRYITQDGKNYQIALYYPNGRWGFNVFVAHDEDTYDPNDRNIGFIYTTEIGKIVLEDYTILLQKLHIK